MTLLFILNDAPYGSEKLYNALRLAMKLQQARTDAEVRVFLKEDTVTAAIPAQTTPQGVLQHRTNVEVRPQQTRTDQNLRHLRRGAWVRQTGIDRRCGDQHDEQLAQLVIYYGKVLTF